MRLVNLSTALAVSSLMASTRCCHASGTRLDAADSRPFGVPGRDGRATCGLRPVGRVDRRQIVASSASPRLAEPSSSVTAPTPSLDFGSLSSSSSPHDTCSSVVHCAAVRAPVAVLGMLSLVFARTASVEPSGHHDDPVAARSSASTTHVYTCLPASLPTVESPASSTAARQLLVVLRSERCIYASSLHHACSGLCGVRAGASCSVLPRTSGVERRVQQRPAPRVPACAGLRPTGLFGARAAGMMFARGQRRPAATAPYACATCGSPVHDSSWVGLHRTDPVVVLVGTRDLDQAFQNPHPRLLVVRWRRCELSGGSPASCPSGSSLLRLAATG